MQLSFSSNSRSWAVGPLGRWAVGPLGRWAVGPLGRWAVGPLMVSAFLCATNSVVQAQAPSPEGGSTLVPGVWRPYYEIVSGKARGTGYVFNFAKDANGYYGKYEVGQSSNYGNAYVQSGGQGGALSSSGYGAGASASTENLEIKVIYKWEAQGSLPAGSQLAPPDPKLNFILNGGAYAQASGGNEHVFVSVNGKDSPEDATTWAWIGAGRLFSFDTKGQTEFNGTMPIQVNASGNGSVSAGFDFSSRLDNRSVRLSRDGAPAAKKATDPNLNQARDEWVDADGTCHGHTLASYWERIMLPPVPPQTKNQIQDDPRDVIQTFTATPSGTWSNNLQFQWTPSETTDTIDHSSQTMPRTDAVNNPEGFTDHLFEQVQTSEEEKGWLNTPAAKGKEFIVTYDLTDNADKATATAKYKLTLHDEWENLIPDPNQSESQRQMFYVISPIFARKPGPGEPQPEWKVTSTTTFSIEGGLNFTGGFKWKDWLNAGLSAALDMKVTLQADQVQNARFVSNIPNTPDNAKFFRVIEFQMQTKHYYADKFGVNGFISCPTTSNLPQSNPIKSKWRQSKDESVGGWTPNWLVIDPADNGADPDVGFKGDYVPETGRSGGAA